MSSITAQELEKPTAPPRNDGGITLLEAYSALAGRDSRRHSAVEIPFPGQPNGGDAENRLWTIRLRNLGC